MKKLPALLITIACFNVMAFAQPFASMSIGARVNDKQMFICPAVSYELRGFNIQGEMKVLVANNQPVIFGLKTSYKYKAIEAGYTRYYQLYSVDKYDLWRNHWSNSVFVRGYLKNYFLECALIDKNQFFSIGYKEKF